MTKQPKKEPLSLTCPPQTGPVILGHVKPAPEAIMPASMLMGQT